MIWSILGMTAMHTLLLFYFTWEMRHYKGQRRNRWWERDIREVL